MKEELDNYSQPEIVIESNHQVTNKKSYYKTNKGCFVIREEWCRNDTIEFVTEEEFNNVQKVKI